MYTYIILSFLYIIIIIDLGRHKQLFGMLKMQMYVFTYWDSDKNQLTSS